MLFALEGGALVALIIAGVIVLLIFCVVVWFISTRNRFIRLEQDVENSLSRIDVYLTKRFDLLTKQLGAVKGYMKHEKDTLVEVIAMRNQAPGKAASIKEKAEFNEELNRVASQINVVMEQYPTLKADVAFKELQGNISEVEENLQAARSNYNANVSNFNKSILQFPASIVAGARFTKKDYFEAEESKKKDVEIKFD